MRSSAARTWRLLASASEWMATVLMPSSLQARMTRNAISPRLAIKTFLNTQWLRYPIEGGKLGGGFRVDEKERLAILDGLGAFHQNLCHAPVHLRLTLVHQLHGFDDTQDLTFFHVIPFFHVGVGIRRGRPVEGSHDWRGDSDEAGGILGRRAGLRGRLGGCRRRGRHLLAHGSGNGLHPDFIADSDPDAC